MLTDSLKGVVCNITEIKMNRAYLILLIILVNISCNGFGPVDMSIETENFKISQDELLGIWKMDSFSYKYLSSFKNDSIKIEFKNDSTFILNTSSKLFDNEIDNTTAKGTWKIGSFQREKSIILKFYDNGSKELQIYKKNKEFQLWHFLSDPDSGERIRFIR